MFSKKVLFPQKVEIMRETESLQGVSVFQGAQAEVMKSVVNLKV